MRSEAAINEVAARQHGVLRRDQAIRAGFTSGEIQARLRTKRWELLHPAVYAIAGTPETYERRVMATVLAAGEGAVASHLTAAAVHRFPDVSRDTLEISVPRDRQARVRGVAMHRPSRLDDVDISVVGVIPITSFARTLVDCTARLSLGQIARALDAGLIARQVSLFAVEHVLEGLPAGRNRRTSVIRMLLDERGEETDKGESRPEMRVHRVLVAAGLPAPTQQHWVHVGVWYRLDLAYPEAKVAIEYDSWQFHRTRTAFDGDRERDRRLALAGWTVLRFTSKSSDDVIVDTVGELVRFAVP